MVAEEYDVVSGELGEESEEEEEEEEEYEEVVVENNYVNENNDNKSRFEEFKWQRVERLRNEVREFGEEIIDVEELSSIYNFRIDKFQVNFQFFGEI